MAQEVVIRDEQGNEHVFPEGFDLNRAIEIVRARTALSGETVVPPVAEVSSERVEVPRAVPGAVTLAGVGAGQVAKSPAVRTGTRKGIASTAAKISKGLDTHPILQRVGVGGAIGATIGGSLGAAADATFAGATVGAGLGSLATTAAGKAVARRARAVAEGFGSRPIAEAKDVAGEFASAPIKEKATGKVRAAEQVLQDRTTGTGARVLAQEKLAEAGTLKDKAAKVSEKFAKKTGVWRRVADMLGELPEGAKRVVTPGAIGMAGKVLAPASIVLDTALGTKQALEQGDTPGTALLRGATSPTVDITPATQWLSEQIDPDRGTSGPRAIASAFTEALGSELSGMTSPLGLAATLYGGPVLQRVGRLARPLAPKLIDKVFPPRAATPALDAPAPAPVAEVPTGALSPRLNPTPETPVTLERALQEMLEELRTRSTVGRTGLPGNLPVRPGYGGRGELSAESIARQEAQGLRSPAPIAAPKSPTGRLVRDKVPTLSDTLQETLTELRGQPGAPSVAPAPVMAPVASHTPASTPARVPSKAATPVASPTTSVTSAPVRPLTVEGVPIQRVPMGARGDEYQAIRESGGAFAEANRKLLPDELDALMQQTGAKTPEEALQLWWELVMRGGL